MARGGKRTGAGHKRVVDCWTMLRIGCDDCEEMHRTERCHREEAYFTELWEDYTAVVTQIPLTNRAGMFGPHQAPLTERVEQFQADADDELAAIVGAECLAAAEAALAALREAAYDPSFWNKSNGSFPSILLKNVPLLSPSAISEPATAFAIRCWFGCGRESIFRWITGFGLFQQNRWKPDPQWPHSPGSGRDPPIDLEWRADILKGRASGLYA